MLLYSGADNAQVDSGRRSPRTRPADDRLRHTQPARGRRLARWNTRCWYETPLTPTSPPHTGLADARDKVISGVREFVCMFVRALKGKRLELSTPNMVHMYSMAVAQH